MKMDVVASDKVRVPKVRRGVATVVRRYDQERAYVLHPDDFRRLMALEELAAAALAVPSIDFSEEAIAAQRDEETPGTSITDPGVLAELFGK